MEINKDNKELFLEKEKSNQNISIKTLKSIESEEKNISKLISIDIKLSENNIKKIEINSPDEIEDKINLFCKENNIPLNVKKFINNVILEELNKNIIKCKYYFI